MLVDSHCHIHDRDTYDFAFSRQQVGKKLLKKYPDLPHLEGDFTEGKLISRAHQNGVEKMICIGTSHEDSLAARDFAARHAKDGVFWAYGIHPDEAEGTQFSGIFATTGANDRESARNDGPDDQCPENLCSSASSVGLVAIGEQSLSASSVGLVAIGEIGLDYRHGTKTRAAQLGLFERMLQLAKDNNLPVIFHIRDAFDDFFAVMNNFPGLKGVVHSFSDNRENLAKSLDRGFYIGVNGLATFAPEIPAKDVPLDRLLLETDAPFLTPAPFRGTINEPAHIKDICVYISRIKGESEANIAKITTKNAEQLFRI